MSPTGELLIKLRRLCIDEALILAGGWRVLRTCTDAGSTLYTLSRDGHVMHELMVSKTCSVDAAQHGVVQWLLAHGLSATGAIVEYAGQDVQEELF
jgi:hypothetical protein